MSTIYLFFCGFKIKIKLEKSQFNTAKEVFKDNFINTFKHIIPSKPHGTPDYTVSVSDISWSSITPIKKKGGYFFCLYNEKNDNQINTHYFISMGLFKVLLMQILQNLTIKSQGILIHASSSIINDKADIFYGISGAGKSTIISLLQNNNKAFADDKVFIIKKSGRFIAYQMPFLEKTGWIERGQKPFPVGRVFFLVKSNNCRIEKIQSKEQAFQEFMSKFDAVKNVFKKDSQTLLNFITSHDCYYLYFSKNKNELTKLLGK